MIEPIYKADEGVRFFSNGIELFSIKSVRTRLNTTENFWEIEIDGELPSILSALILTAVNEFGTVAKCVLNNLRPHPYKDMFTANNVYWWHWVKSPEEEIPGWS